MDDISVLNLFLDAGLVVKTDYYYNVLSFATGFTSLISVHKDVNG